MFNFYKHLFFGGRQECFPDNDHIDELVEVLAMCVKIGGLGLFLRGNGILTRQDWGSVVTTRTWHRRITLGAKHAARNRSDIDCRGWNKGPRGEEDFCWCLGENQFVHHVYRVRGVSWRGTRRGMGAGPSIVVVRGACTSGTDTPKAGSTVVIRPFVRSDGGGTAGT